MISDLSEIFTWRLGMNIQHLRAKSIYPIFQVNSQYHDIDLEVKVDSKFSSSVSKQRVAAAKSLCLQVSFSSSHIKKLGDERCQSESKHSLYSVAHHRTFTCSSRAQSRIFVPVRPMTPVRHR